MLVMPMMLLLASILTPLTIPASSVLASPTILTLFFFMFLVLLQLILSEAAHNGSTDGTQDTVPHLVAAESASSTTG